MCNCSLSSKKKGNLLKFSKTKSYYRALNGLFLLLLLINVQQLLQPMPTAKAEDPLILKWKYNAAATTQAAVSGDLNGDGVYDVVISGVGKVVAINGAAADLVSELLWRNPRPPVQSSGPTHPHRVQA